MAERGELDAVAPFFFVKDVVAATEHYVNALGFTQPRYWGGERPTFAMPTRDGLTVMLSRAEDPAQIRSNNPKADASDGPWDAYFWVADARALCPVMQAAGANVAYGPVLQEYYDNWEFAVRDLDGYLLAFGSAAETG